MPGELVDCSVFIRDQREASQTFSKGNFGYPMSGGGLELDLVEAAFLLELQRLEIIYKKRRISFTALFDYASGIIDDFAIKYLVFKDLRERGFIVKPDSGSFDFHVYPRGQLPAHCAPVYLVCAVSERSATNLKVFADTLTESEDIGKKLLYGVVDEEGDVTYYKMFDKDPKGFIFPESDGSPIKAKLVGDRVFVFNEDDGTELYGRGFYGKLSKGVLQLSIIEACYLIEKGELKVSDREGNHMDVGQLTDYGRKNQDEFDLRMKAYVDLRNRGLVVKTGFKYGTHFRVYEKSPDDCHARYLVHAVPASTVAMWPEISRTVRLSGGVKKEILFCRVSNEVEYLEFLWFRP